MSLYRCAVSASRAKAISLSRSVALSSHHLQTRSFACGMLPPTDYLSGPLWCGPVCVWCVVGVSERERNHESFAESCERSTHLVFVTSTQESEQHSSGGKAISFIQFVHNGGLQCSGFLLTCSDSVPAHPSQSWTRSSDTEKGERGTSPHTTRTRTTLRGCTPL